MDIRVDPMLPCEARDVAALHCHGIPDGFLSKLGARFCTQLYRGIASAPRSGVWVAKDESDRVLGYVSGTADVGRCYRSVLVRRGLMLAVCALPATKHGRTWRSIGETLRYPWRRFASGAGARPVSRTKAELLSIVVGDQGRGRGIASRLVRHLEHELVRWDCEATYWVVTMATDPRSNAFYVKVGFRAVRDFEHHGVRMRLYRKELVRS